MKKIILLLALWIGLFSQAQQVAIEVDSTIKIYNDYPKTFTDANGVTILNYRKADVLKKYEDGFRDVVQPIVNNEIERRGSIYFDNSNDVFTYYVFTLTAEELDARIPTVISKLNFKTGLLMNHGITNAMVQAFFDTLTDPILKAGLELSWYESTTFDRTDANLINFAPQLGLTEEDLKQIFKQYSGNQI
jgi:hypothetical protein